MLYPESILWQRGLFCWEINWLLTAVIRGHNNLMSTIENWDSKITIVRPQIQVAVEVRN